MAVPMRPDAEARPGEIVVARRPDRPTLEIVKRVERVLESGEYVLAGDNPATSTDSRQFGPVAREHIIARVTWRYWPLPLRRLS